jgi:hypothetical protein
MLQGTKSDKKTKKSERIANRSAIQVFIFTELAAAHRVVRCLHRSSSSYFALKH